MQRLNKKLILEFLDDDKLSVKYPVEEAIEQPVEVVEEQPVEVVETTTSENLTDGEKKNFIVSTLTDLSTRMLELFNYLTPLMTLEVEDTNSVFNNLSEENKDLLRSIYEDVSLLVGKVTQGLKDNTEENIQGAIDDGQTQAQELTAPVENAEHLNEDVSDMNKDLEDLFKVLEDNVDMGDYFDELKGNEEKYLSDLKKNPKQELVNWKNYYKENKEMLDKIDSFEKKYFKE